MIRKNVAGTLILFVATAAHANQLAVQTSNRPTAGRIVIEFATKAKAAIRQHGNHVQISVDNDLQIATPERLPRNVVSFVGGQGVATLDISPYSKLTPTQKGNRLTLEIVDVAARKHGHDETEAGRANPAWKPALPVAVQTAPAATPSVPPPAVATVAPAAKPADPATATAATAAAPTAVASPKPEVTEAAPKSLELIELPAKPEVGAAAFRRGDLGVVVFDDRLDTSGIEEAADPKRLTIQQLSNGTMLSVKLLPGEELALNHRTYGWQVSVDHVTPHPATQTAAPFGTIFDFGQAGHALSVADPLTSQTLLIGTLRESTGEHLMVAERRVAPGYVLLPTWLGLAVGVSSDAVDVLPTTTGFSLQALDRSAPDAAIAATAENSLGIPRDSLEVLRRRLSAEIISAADTPPRARGHQRIMAARTMLALGLDAEAQALLSVAINADPAVASDPQAVELSAAAAILAGRPDEAASIDDLSLPATRDVEMWRGLRAEARGEPAPRLGSEWPLLATYPPAVRDWIGPPIIEAAIKEGLSVPAPVLEAPGYALARALKLEKAGDVDGALKALDDIVNGRDERDSVRAAVAAVELRLAEKKITAAEAADAIERQTVRWRGDRQEMTMRLRVAELRQQAGQWRPALAELRDVKTLFPSATDLVSSRREALFEALLGSAANAISPLDLVTVVGDYADSLPTGPKGDQLAGLLADKLLALDLPTRAKPVLEQLLAKAGSPVAQAAFALRLAQVDLDAGDPATAQNLLQKIDDSQLSPETSQQRTQLLARARAESGDAAGAALLLSNETAPSAEQSRADYLAKSGDWKGSLQIDNLLVSATVAAQGDLSDQQQDLLLRTATAAVHAGDTSAIEQLRPYSARLHGPRADLFRFLVQPTVDKADDLPRVARELAMARDVPQQLNALGAR